MLFRSPLKDNTGKELFKADETHPQTDIALESMNYLVEGVKGKVN